MSDPFSRPYVSVDSGEGVWLTDDEYAALPEGSVRRLRPGEVVTPVNEPVAPTPPMMTPDPPTVREVDGPAPATGVDTKGRNMVTGEMLP